MKLKSISLTFLFLLIPSVHLCLSQNPDLQSKPLPSFAEKYNRSPLGGNVFVFEPGMDMKEIQLLIDTIFARQSVRRSEFSKNRYALLFKPGEFELDVKVDYYMQVLGLGESPEDVVIKGAVRSNTTHGNSVLTNFWRCCGKPHCDTDSQFHNGMGCFTGSSVAESKYKRESAALR